MASKTKIYIVLEFVQGGELFDKIVSILVSILSQMFHKFPSMFPRKWSLSFCKPMPIMWELEFVHRNAFFDPEPVILKESCMSN